MKKQIVSFIAAGVVNTLFYYIMYIFFIWIGFDYRLAVLLATVIGVVFSYNTFGKYVFFKKSGFMFVKFIIVYAVLYFLNIFFIKVFNNAFHNYYASGFAAAVICAGFSFVLNKFIVYR